MPDLFEQLDRLCIVYVKNRWLRVATKDARLRRAIMDAMRFELVTREYRPVRGRMQLINVKEPIDMYEVIDYAGVPNIVVGRGRYEQLVKVIHESGVEMKIVDAETNTVMRQHANIATVPLKVTAKDWDSLRQWQKDSIRLFNTYVDGRWNVATGGGKSRLIRFLCKFLSTSRILVVAKGQGLVEDLHTSIMQSCTSVGIHHGQKNDPEGRILVCSLGCLEAHLHQKWDVVLGDEIHEHVTMKALENLARVQADRMYGFSANVDDRQDNADAWAHTLYGPVRLVRTYADVEADGDVVPIEVEWLDLEVCQASVGSRASMATKSRVLIWKNEQRNRAFINAAMPHIEAGRQVLFLVSTTEHALELRKLLGCPVVVNPPDKAKREKYIRQKLVPPDFQFMNKRELVETQKSFARGEIRVIIANSIWHRAKDFPGLDVLARLDGNASEIGSTQIPGRLSRTKPGKTKGVLIDSLDKWNETLKRRAAKRRKSYREKGWRGNG